MKLHISTVFLFGFSVVAIAVFSAEFRSFNLSQQSSIAQITRPAPLRTALPFSLSTTQSLLLVCDRALSAPLANLQPSKDLLASARSCGDFAERVLGWMPTYGFAYLVAAQSAYHRRDLAARDNFLERSFAFAPFEGWLAERRFALIINSTDTDPSKLNAPTYEDIATLFSTQSGVELLASYYIRRPATRPALSKAAAVAGQQYQSRFINQLRLKQAER